MSCFVRIATKLTDVETVRAAVTALGFRVLAGHTEVRGWEESTVPADLVIGTDTSYDIGAVRAADGTLELVADWGMARVDRQDFVDRLAQKYSHLRVLATARRQGFVVAKEQVDEQGTVRLLLRKFV